MSKAYFFLSDTPAAATGENKREAWFPKTGDGYFDPSAKRYFNTKREKRAWMAAQKMRETGELVNPSKVIAGREKSRIDPAMKRFAQEQLARSGGTAGLLQRIQQQQGVFV